MPAATTHYEFAIDVLNQLKNPNQIIDKNLFYLGAQGPDLLFFSKLSMLPGSLKKYGNLMHDEKVKEVISFFLQKSKEYPLFQSYLYGYFCHYALDATVHPIICYEASMRARRNQSTESVEHLEVEASLDYYTLKQRGKTITQYDVYKHLKVSKEARVLLASIYHEMFQEIYGLDIKEKEIAQSIIDIVRLTHFLKPNQKVKYRAVQHLEKLIGIPSLVSSMMLNQKEEPWLLNASKQNYVHPSKENHTDYSSYEELYTQAIQFAKSLIEEDTLSFVKYDFMGRPI